MLSAPFAGRVGKEARSQVVVRQVAVATFHIFVVFRAQIEDVVPHLAHVAARACVRAHGKARLVFIEVVQHLMKKGRGGRGI